MKRTDDNIIPALVHAKYEPLDKLNQKRYKKSKSSIDKPGLSLMVALFSALLDGTVIYSIVDRAITQSQFMSWMVTAGVALALNLLPIILAKFVKETIYKIRRNSIIPMILLISLFVFLYSATVFLRFAYSDMNGSDKYEKQHLVNMSTSGENPELVTDEDILTEKSVSHDAANKSLAVTLLLSLSPLVTSGIAFAIAYSSDDVVHKHILALEEELIKIDQAICDLKVEEENLKKPLQDALDLDEQEMNLCIDMTFAKVAKQKALARLILDKLKGTPSQISKNSSEIRCDLENKYLREYESEPIDGSDGETEEDKNLNIFPDYTFTDVNRAERSLI